MPYIYLYSVQLNKCPQLYSQLFSLDPPSSPFTDHVPGNLYVISWERYNHHSHLSDEETKVKDIIYLTKVTQLVSGRTVLDARQSNSKPKLLCAAFWNPEELKMVALLVLFDFVLE